MKLLTLTYTENRSSREYIINCDKIHLIFKHGDVTWINLGNEQCEFKVDQTPEEIIELINEFNK
jgi:hypothetical protein